MVKEEISCWTKDGIKYLKNYNHWRQLLCHTKSSGLLIVYFCWTNNLLSTILGKNFYRAGISLAANVSSHRLINRCWKSLWQKYHRPSKLILISYLHLWFCWNVLFLQDKEANKLLLTWLHSIGIHMNLLIPYVYLWFLNLILTVWSHNSNLNKFSRAWILFVMKDAGIMILRKHAKILT